MASRNLDAELELESLIAKLDDGRFAVRENATRELVTLGETAIKPVASYFFKATPETAWRIKRVLEQIAIDTNEEETSLKAIGVLSILDQERSGELTGLLTTWRENRSNRAIQYLVSKGASTNPDIAQQQMFMMNQGIGIRSLTIVNRDKAQPLRNDLRKTKRLSEADALKEIESIANGSFMDVQEFVFDRLPQANDPAEQDLLINGQFIRQVNRAGIGIGNRKSNGVFLEFAENWKGDSNDLLRLSEIHSLDSIRFVGQELNSSLVKVINQLSGIRHFGYISANRNSVPFADLDLPESVSSFELGNLSLDKSTARWLASRPINYLTLNDCEIPESARSEFSKLTQLYLLDLHRINIDRDLFRQLEELTGLQHLRLSVCKFKAADYQHFTRARPKVAYPNPVSFLGVRARRTMGSEDTWTCQIEMVVADSGADEAGIKEGDVIESVNGDEVKTFEELRMHISQYEIGEAMDLKIRRDGKQIELTTILGSNPENPVR